jgi:hypothetical protein
VSRFGFWRECEIIVDEDGGCGMKEALIVIVAVAFGVYVTAKRFQHRFTSGSVPDPTTIRNGESGAPCVFLFEWS